MKKLLIIHNIFPVYIKGFWDKFIFSDEIEVEFYFSSKDFNGIKGLKIKNNYDKVKVGKKYLNLVETSSYVNGMYFYARDAKILQFINIIIGGAIRRVDKIINKTHIDK